MKHWRELQRRTFLKAIGLGIAAPLAASMASRVGAAGPGRPARLMVLYHPDGVPPEHYTPRGKGTDFDLNVGEGVLAPFEDYKASLNDTPRDNVIGPYLQIVNHTAADGVALDSLQLRYYLTNEHAARCPDTCLMEGYYAGIHPSGKSVVAARSYIAVDGARAYLAIGFEPGSPKLMPGESVEVQQQFHVNPYEDFDESDDYSFDATHGAYADTEKVTIYQDGKRVWGTPPAWP